MNPDLKKLLLSAIQKYGAAAYITNPKSVEKNWERCSCSAEATVSSGHDLSVRHAIMGSGQILEENLDQHTYITTIRVGKVFFAEVLMVTHLQGTNLSIAAYAQEGLIPQHLAQKAVALVTERLK